MRPRAGSDACTGPGADALPGARSIYEADLRRPPCPPFRLRPATPGDGDFFFSTREAAFRVYVEAIWGWDDVQQRAAANRDFAELPVQIVESDGVGIGYLCLVRRADIDLLDEIALLREWRGRGIGSSLVRDAMASAASRGVAIHLSVLFNNPARNLYDRMGFRATAVEHPRVKMEWIANDSGV